MHYHNLYWNLFIQSGDPEAYMQYKQLRAAEHAVHGRRRTARRLQDGNDPA